ncbi:hypothetical protein [Burkholderia sp. PU8-34]
MRSICRSNAEAAARHVDSPRRATASRKLSDDSCAAHCGMRHAAPIVDTLTPAPPPRSDAQYRWAPLRRQRGKSRKQF